MLEEQVMVPLEAKHLTLSKEKDRQNPSGEASLEAAKCDIRPVESFVLQLL